MKAIKNMSMIMGAALMLASCESIKEDVCPSENTVEITASIADGQTKTAVQDGGTAVYWQPGDEVKVFYDGTGSKFTSLCTDLSRTSKFTGTLNVMFGFDEGFSDDTPLWGLYPYREDATADNASVTTTLPSEQIACEGTFAQATNISVARSTGLSMAFYNVCGGVRFKLSTEGVTSVTMKSNGGEALAGKVKIGFDDENHPEILEITEPMSEVTLTCEGGFKTDAWYYIVTLPGTLDEGVTFTMQTDSLKAKKVIDRSLTVKRSVFGSISSLDEAIVWKDREDNDIVKPAANQIFYTSSDEQTLTSFNGAIYDAGGNKLTLVSNKYSNGKGVMTFSGEVDMIDTQAFYNRPRLVSLTLPEGLRTIEDSAITDNIRLESLYLPESLTYIGNHCFENNAKLSNISTLGSITTLGCYFVQGCSSLASIVIPESVRTIRSCAFYGCNGLTFIVIPGSVRAINSYAFFDCSSLTSIVIPEGVTSIGDYAFHCCSSLTSVVIPEGVTSIGDYAFYGCSSLTSVVIPEGVTSIGTRTFYSCSSLTSIVIPEGVTSIGDHAFQNCSSLTSIVIPEGVTSIGGGTFSECSCLTSIVIPEGVTSIGDQAFNKCSSLTSIVIPEGVTSIANQAFSGCSCLTSIVIPESVTSIGVVAFSKCSSLTSIVIPEGVTSIGDQAFSDCSSLTSIVIPEGVTSIGTRTFMNCISLTSIIIPDGVKTISSYAFQNCSSLASIVLPEGDSSKIYGYAFSGCSSLTSIVIPNGVTSIGSWAFSDCRRLAMVTCESSTPPTLESTSFNRCDSLSRIYVPMGSVDAYKSAQGWSLYRSKIQAAGPEMVDLGLSVKWASCNLGATKPEEYGDYYAWAATEPWYEPGYAKEKPQQHWKAGKSDGYAFVNAPYQTATTTVFASTRWTKYLGSVTSKYKAADATDNAALKTILDPEDDAAHASLGSKWRMPSADEFEELSNSCRTEWTTINGVNGMKFTSKTNGNSIFLPAAGAISTSLSSDGNFGLYWSSSLCTENPYCAICFDVSPVNFVQGTNNRCFGRSIRPVSE